MHLTQNKLSGVGAELEEDRWNGVEMRELNDKKNYFTGPFGNQQKTGGSQITLTQLPRTQNMMRSDFSMQTS